MKMRADYNHATGRWEITDTDATPPSTFAEVSDEARAKLLANTANNFAPMRDALQKALRYIAAYRVEAPSDDAEPGALIWPGEARALYTEARELIAQAAGGAIRAAKEGA